MGIYKILGVSRREPLTASYLDCKQINDKAVMWRQKVRLVVADYRRIRTDLASDRHLLSRHLLILEEEMVRRHIEMCWVAYRAVQHDARVIRQEYLKQLSCNKEKAARRTA